MPKTLSTSKQATLLATLEKRFNAHAARHKGLTWNDVQKRLESNPEKLVALEKMEATGGEPDVIWFNKKSNEVTFVDCAEESPKGRRSLCFDGVARKGRKEHPPKSSAIEMAKKMGITILNEEEYRGLQEVIACDTKTSSWIQTPASIRQRGGALFMDRRYDAVFMYHNGADSYYASRGFRGSLTI